MAWEEFLAERKRVFINQGTRELILISRYWPMILIAVIPQYVHGIFTNIVFYLYNHYNVDEQELLFDLGFKFFGDVNREFAWLSEFITFGLLTLVIIWSLVPFLVERRNFYATFIIRRYLVVVSTALIIRIVSFTVTILPSPSPDCRSDSPGYNPPDNWIYIFFNMDAVNGCADLIFSSHTGYTIASVLSYSKYGKNQALKLIGYALIPIVGLMIIAFRHHYSVDVWLAWTIMPLSWLVWDPRLVDELPEALIAFEKTCDERNEPRLQELENRDNEILQDNSDLNRENSDRRLLAEP